MSRHIARLILLDTVDKVKDFVQQTLKFMRESEVSSGRYVVNAKSIIGVLSLDLSKPVTFTYSEDDEELAKMLVGKYFYKEKRAAK